MPPLHITLSSAVHSQKPRPAGACTLTHRQGPDPHLVRLSRNYRSRRSSRRKQERRDEFPNNKKSNGGETGVLKVLNANSN